MAEFKLDTSGMVYPMEPRVRLPAGDANAIKWSDLSPFAQGYVEAAFASLSPRGYRYETGSSAPEYRPWAFSDLAPETLAAMLKDCERRAEPLEQLGTHAYGGGNFWRDRQVGHLIERGFPPVALYLGGDGLIHQREASR